MEAAHAQQPLLEADPEPGPGDALIGDALGVESLDYDPIHSTVYAHSKRRSLQRHLYGYTGLTFAKWSVTLVVGVLVGLLGYCISTCQEFIIVGKKHLAQEFINRGGLWVAFLGYASFGILLVMISSCVVLYLAPAAAGGGVTLVIAYLNGNDIPNFFKFNTLIAKIIGTICTISSGLPLGQEGPMVHIGGAIASTLTWMHGEFPTSKKKKHSAKADLCCCLCQPKACQFDFHNDRDRREFISAGTAAGLAAAFGAPIGGVLFSLEEASSFWSRKVMWRSIVCTATATMVIAWLQDRGFSFVLPSHLSFHGLQPEFNLQDLPLFVVTSLGAGMMGALLNTSHTWLINWRPPSANKVQRLVEACLVTFVCIALMFVLPFLFGRCLEIQNDQMVPEPYWFQYACPSKQENGDVSVYNDLATMYFSLPHETIQKLLELGGSVETPFTISSLGIHAVSFLIMFILSYGIATPGGIFMPSILVGASFGAFMGRIYELLIPSANVQPGHHALMGASAMLGGVFRTSISLVVIMVEGTGGIEFILPVILAIVVSNYVAHYIHPSGAYEADLDRLGDVCFLHSEPSHELLNYTATDIMSEDVVTFEEVPLLSEVIETLRSCQHNGFPVLQQDKSGRQRQLAGLILRHQLLVLIEQRVFVEVDLKTRALPPEKEIGTDEVFLDHAMRVYHHCHYRHRRDLSSRPEALEDLEVGEVLAAPNPVISATESNGSNQTAEIKANAEEVPKKELALDLRPFMNRAPLTVRAECSAHRVFIIFRILGLRHLCVTDSHNRVIGMITRKDLAHARQVAAARSGRILRHMDSDIQARNAKGGQDVLYNLP